MIFGNRRRLEEDLERIRLANLPEEKLREEEEKAAARAEKLNRTKYEKGDIPALIFAAFSVLLPYLLAIIGIYAVLMFGYVWLFG